MKNAAIINKTWMFRQGFQPEYVLEDYDVSEKEWEQINLPHTVQMIPYDCFDQYMTCMVSTYIKELELEEIQSKRVLISFEGVSAYYDFYVNGKLAGSHKGAYSMALFDITEYIHSGKNRLALMVDSNERDDIPPNGSTVDYLIYGGIYRDVTLYIQEDIYLRHQLIRYEVEEISNGKVRLYPELLFTNRGEEQSVQVECRLLDGEETIEVLQSQALIGTGETSISVGERQLENISLWTPDAPKCYRVVTSIYDHDGVLLDSCSSQTGFRSISVTPDGFFLNGERILLNGLNRHQSFPYVGYALGRRAQEKDARLLKEFMNCNMVRCSHYMQSRYFLDCCDEIGLLVLEEIPGWGFIGEDDFRQVVFNDLNNMVLGHFNHPSIVIWGTRLNETVDCDELYEETNRRCKEMDPSRPTTGVRWETGSHLIEDIYSYNDYSEDDKGEFMLLTAHQVTESTEKHPYLLSEHTGAVLPTKPWDSEERQEAFALRHARVLSKVQTVPGYLGALGWCMNDYNTHNDHNSLNKVCYHGVLDMFRVPKSAAYVYASQKDPKQGIVLEPSSAVGRGERCEPVPFFVFTNCDYIQVTLSTDVTRTYYPSVKFPGLAHPPIEVTENGEFWQKRWMGARIDGYLDGKLAVSRIYSDNPRLSAMRMEIDDPVLDRDLIEETRVVVYFEDENGNRLYQHQEAVQVTVSGELELIGPSIISTKGGTAAFWVRTSGDGNRAEARIQVIGERMNSEGIIRIQ